MTERWSAARANAWYDEQPWLVGCNFIPSTAINQLEMWGEGTFDPETIDRELGLAAALGMNTVRTYLHDRPWTEDEAGFRARLDRFLTLADAHGIRPLLVLFDDCWYEPEVGVPEPRPGLHNSGWVRSPGRAILSDRGAWPRLEAYVRGVLRAFGRDPRVLAWDVYNEVTNEYLPILSRPQPQRALGLAATAARLRLRRPPALDLMTAAFGWARAEGPDQPLTAASWHPAPHLHDALYGLSDVISFHNYDGPDSVRAEIKALRAHDRPLMCTEWLSRAAGSTVAAILPILARERVAAFGWGLVDGKTQTKFSWADRPDGDAVREPDPWFHDLIRADGSPYDEAEAALFRELTGRGGSVTPLTPRRAGA